MCYLLLMHDTTTGQTRVGAFSEQHPTLPLSVITGVIAEFRGESYADALAACHDFCSGTYAHPGVKKMVDAQDGSLR